MRENLGWSRWDTLALLLVCAASLAFRFWLIWELPPGLNYDEAYDALDGLQGARAGVFRLFYEGNYGREPLSMWVLTAAHLVFPPSSTLVRSVSAGFGAATPPLVYLAARLIFGRQTALFAGLALAALLWHVMISRFGSRVATFPFAAALALWLCARMWRSPGRWNSLAAGAALGLTQYTYLAARLAPAIVAIAVLGALAAGRESRRRLGAVALPYVAASVVVAAPLLGYFVANPEVALGRSSQVLAAVDSADAAEAGTLRENVVKTLGMFLVAGDERYVINVPGRPAFDWALAAGFAVGVGAALSGRRGFVAVGSVGALLVMILPSALTTYAPHFFRASGGVIPAALLIGIGFAAIANPPARLGRLGRAVGRAAAVALLVLGGWRSAVDYFDVWANDLASFTSFDVGVARMGEALGSAAPDEAVYATPFREASPALTYLSGGRDVRTFDGRHGAVLPSVGRAAVFGVVVAYDGETEALLRDVAGGGPGAGGAAFRPSPILDPVSQAFAIVGRVVAQRPPLPLWAAPAAFQEGVTLLGADVPDSAAPGGTVEVTSVWRATGPTREPLTMFVHVVEPGDPTFRVLTQNDHQPLDGTYPTSRWREGELVVDYTLLRLPRVLPSRAVRLLIGWYNARTGERLSLGDRSFAVLGDVPLR